MATISLCMIVKDEEKFLEQCLLSVQGLVDEIVIVDTGSTDKTKEIALRFTSKVYDFVWGDDFAAARNESLKYATGEWILILDADEVIAQQDHTIIKGLLMRAETERDIYGYILIQRNYFRSKEDSQYGSFSGITVSAASQDGEGFISAENDNYEESKGMEGWLATPIVRLCKNTGSTAFSGVVHEDVSPSLPGRIIKTGIVLHHFGKIDSQNWQRKWELYEKLGKKKAFNGENDYYAYFELGRQYLENRKIDLAIEMLRKSIELNTDFWLSWFNLGTVELITGKIDGAILGLEKARAINPQVGQIYDNLGVAYAQRKQFEKAIEIFNLGIGVAPEKASLYKHVGRCYYAFGRQKEAYLAFKKALELNPRYKTEIK